MLIWLPGVTVNLTLTDLFGPNLVIYGLQMEVAVTEFYFDTTKPTVVGPLYRYDSTRSLG
jgi:hypothetical protein